MSLYDHIPVPDGDGEASKKPSVSLYEGLEDEDVNEKGNSVTIEKEPVKYNVDSSLLRFQPTVRKRQVGKKKTKSSTLIVRSIQNNRLELEESTQPVSTQYIEEAGSYWDQDYDPEEPNIYKEYIHSEEKLAEEEDWEDYLARWELNPNAASSTSIEFTKSTESDDKTGSMEEEPSSVNDPEPVPDKSGIGSRLLQKYGWKPGKGLGASEDGIVNPLHFSKNKRRPGSGRIVDKNKNSRQKQQPSETSPVVMFPDLLSTDPYNCHPIEEIPSIFGTYCQFNYGPVTRVATNPPNIFVKFQNELSALRAVNNSQTLAKFYSEESFEQGIF